MTRPLKTRQVRVVEGTSAPRRGSATARLFWTFVIIGVVLYAAIFLMARTAGFRSFVQERLSAQLDLPVTIHRSHATAGLDMVFRDVTAGTEETPGAARLDAEEIRLKWSLRSLLTLRRPALRSVTLRGAHITFAQNAEGRWSPRALSRFAKWVSTLAGFKLGLPKGPEDDEEAAKNKANRKDRGSALFRGMNLRVEGAGVEWVDASGTKAASVTGLSLSATQLDAPDREMTHFLVRADGLWSAQGRSSTDLKLELLRTGDQTIVLQLGMGDSPEKAGEAQAPQPDPARDDGESAPASDPVPEDLRQTLREAIEN